MGCLLSLTLVPFYTKFCFLISIYIFFKFPHCFSILSCFFSHFFGSKFRNFHLMAQTLNLKILNISSGFLISKFLNSSMFLNFLRGFAKFWIFANFPAPGPAALAGPTPVPGPTRHGSVHAIHNPSTTTGQFPGHGVATSAVPKCCRTTQHHHQQPQRHNGP